VVLINPFRKEFALYDAVNPFCQCILIGAPTLCHANSNIGAGKQFGVVR
jgi:hypothetical protein